MFREDIMNYTLKSTLIAACIALGSSAAAETVLRLGSVAPSTSPWGQWAAGVAAAIEEKTGGSLKIELLLDAQAGDEQTILRQTMRSRMDIALVSNTPLTLIAPEIGLAAAPYVFDTVEQGSCVTHQHMSNAFGDMMTGAGVVPLTWMEVGQYIVFSKEPLKVPADLEGKRLRVAANVTDEVYARALGTSGVPMGTSDTIPALQTGNVDAAFFPTVFGIAIGTHQVAPHVVLTNHARLIGTVSISERSWSKLSAEEQAVLKGAFGEAGPKLTQMILGAEKALLGKISDAGIPVYTPTDEELAQWRGMAETVATDVAADLGDSGTAVLDAINAAKLACQ